MKLPPILAQYIRWTYDFTDDGEIVDPLDVVYVERIDADQWEISWIGGVEEVRLAGDQVVQIYCDRL